MGSKIHNINKKSPIEKNMDEKNAKRFRNIDANSSYDSSLKNQTKMVDFVTLEPINVTDIVLKCNLVMFVLLIRYFPQEIYA